MRVHIIYIVLLLPLQRRPFRDFGRQTQPRCSEQQCEVSHPNTCVYLCMIVGGCIYTMHIHITYRYARPFQSRPFRHFGRQTQPRCSEQQCQVSHPYACVYLFIVVGEFVFTMHINIAYRSAALILKSTVSLLLTENSTAPLRATMPDEPPINTCIFIYDWWGCIYTMHIYIPYRSAHHTSKSPGSLLRKKNSTPSLRATMRGEIHLYICSCRSRVDVHYACMHNICLLSHFQVDRFATAGGRFNRAATNHTCQATRMHFFFHVG